MNTRQEKEILICEFEDLPHSFLWAVLDFIYFLKHKEPYELLGSFP